MTASDHEARRAGARGLRRRRPAEIARMLSLNVLLTVALFVPLGAFLVLRDMERANDTNDKLPWLRFYGDPSTTIAISWETNASTTTYLEYGASPANLSTNVTSMVPVTMHHVHLDGLLPGTAYHYRVGAIDEGTGIAITGDTYSFKTAPAGNAPFTFVVVSDTQESYLGMNHHQRVARAIKNEALAGARFVVHGGDVANYGQRQDSWNYFFKHASAYSPILPFVFTLGNHDNMGGAALFRRYYAFNQTGEPLYHSFNYSSQVHVTSIPFPYGRDEEFDQDMLDWLDEDLNRSSAVPLKIVVFHCPVLSSGFFGRHRELETRVHPILARHGVALVINGHSHHYERCELDGVTYVVVAGGGGMMDPCHNLLPETRAIHNVPHYVRVTVHGTGTMLYEALTPDGVLFDAATLGGGAP